MTRERERGEIGGEDEGGRGDSDEENEDESSGSEENLKEYLIGVDLEEQKRKDYESRISEIHKSVSYMEESKFRVNHIVKKLVSKRRRRYMDSKFDLDLTYITHNIIAMGFPSKSIQKLYRNSLIDVQRWVAPSEQVPE